MNKYTSLFKINGTPILPPLITPERSNEYKKYKNQAIAIENKQTMVDYDDYGKFTNINKNCTKDVFMKKKEVLQKSDTLIYDVISNIVMIPNEKSNYELSILECIEDDVTILHKESVKNSDLSDSSQVPLITINSPKKYLKDMCVEKCGEKEIIQESNSSPNIPSGKEELHLIRSNSFTLEKPSEALTNELLKKESKLKNEKLLCDNDSKNILWARKKDLNYTLWQLERPKRSPYEVKLTAKTLKKHKNANSKSNKFLQKKKLYNSSGNEDNEFLKSTEITKLLEQFDQERKLNLKELFIKHKEEENKIKSIYENQEKVLLELFKCQTIKDLNSKEKQYWGEQNMNVCKLKENI